MLHDRWLVQLHSYPGTTMQTQLPQFLHLFPARYPIFPIVWVLGSQDNNSGVAELWLATAGLVIVIMLIWTSSVSISSSSRPTDADSHNVISTTSFPVPRACFSETNILISF